MSRVIRHSLVQFPDDVPFYEHQELLVSMSTNTLYNYNDPMTMESRFFECSRRLTANPFTSLLPGIESGDGETILEIGLR